MDQMTPLRRRLIDDMTVRNLSPATQQSYVYAVAKFSRFFGLPPDRLGVEQVRAYQTTWPVSGCRGLISTRCRARCVFSSV